MSEARSVASTHSSFLTPSLPSIKDQKRKVYSILISRQKKKTLELSVQEALPDSQTLGSTLELWLPGKPGRERMGQNMTVFIGWGCPCSPSHRGRGLEGHEMGPARAKARFQGPAAARLLLRVPRRVRPPWARCRLQLGHDPGLGRTIGRGAGSAGCVAG